MFSVDAELEQFMNLNVLKIYKFSKTYLVFLNCEMDPFALFTVATGVFR